MCWRLRKYVKKEYFRQLIEAKKKKYKLSDHMVRSPSLARAYVYGDGVIVNSICPDSPMMEVEPSLLDLMIKMSQIRRFLTPTQYLKLASDLISGTKTRKKCYTLKTYF